MSNRDDNWTLQVAKTILKNDGALVDPVAQLPVVESVLPPLTKFVIDKFKKED